MLSGLSGPSNQQKIGSFKALAGHNERSVNYYLSVPPFPLPLSNSVHHCWRVMLFGVRRIGKRGEERYGKKSMINLNSAVMNKCLENIVLLLTKITSVFIHIQGC